MNTDKHKLWVEKYRPSTFDDYIFHDDSHRTALEQMVEDGTIPQILFSGVQGSGKTTAALILTNELQIDPADVLTINASDENSVDVMRDKIKSFVSTFAMGDFKIVHLEEADYITANGQAVLRRMMEEYADTARFILTCNYEHKIIPAVKSRCQQFRFQKHNVDEVTEYVAKILLQERVKFDLDVLDKYVRVGYPDIRKIINSLQQNSHNGKLMESMSDTQAGDYKFELLDLLETDNWSAARELLCKEVATEEWEDVYRFLYENIGKSKKFSNRNNWESAIVIIADHLYKHSAVSDAEINGAAMLIRLAQI
jgi:DNA polymerase III delta prime subunit